MQKLKAKLFSFIAVLLFGLPISGFAATVGQQFRDIMAEIDAQCRKDKMGPYLDPTDPHYIDKRAITDCDILKIKPADPLATEEGRFAYSIKLPAPHDKLKAEYRPGMGAETYFKSLCEKDAGEWIFKTVEGVWGVFQGRRMEPYPAAYSDLVFFARELTGVLSERMEDYLVQPYHGRYSYLEIPSNNTQQDGKKFSLYFRGTEVAGHFKVSTQKNKRPIRVPYIVNIEQTDTLNSLYGYTWRQVADKAMLENGIAGGELIIFDRTSNEVLAFRRFFVRHWPRADSRYTRLTNGEGCQPGFTNGEHVFIQKVLVPINPAE